MTSENIPPNVHYNPYNRMKVGYTGELGEGANARISFLQTVIKQEELDEITLISNIPGSETWDVRDLFQRDVDDERVEKDIIPYLKDKTKVKFFNPLTLILIPMDEMGREVLKDIEYIEPIYSEEERIPVQILEKKDYYKFKLFQSSNSYGQLEWNDHKCFLVAIDGQHRLSAMKRWKKEPGSNFADWRIPVVILNINRVDKRKATANLLEIVRKTFVYINTKAERVNKAREILLNDESVNAICTQELIQHSHKNDNKPINQRDNTIVPLIFFDWRGEVKNNIPQFGPAAVKSIEEIHSWFENYILLDDGDEWQESQLHLTDLVPPLEGYGIGKTLSHKDAERIRHQCNTLLLPGLLHFFQNFKPYKDYISLCREIEKEAIERSDNAKHAFMQLRFGSHNAPPDQFGAVSKEYTTLVEKYDEIKHNMFPETLDLDIGMRGIMFAYGYCKEILEELKNKSYDWLEYSKLFTDQINEIYEERWFNSYRDLDAKKRKFLTHVIFDDAQSIINYKLQHAGDALGALMVLLVFKKLLEKKKIKVDHMQDIWDEQSNNLRKTIERGLRRFHKSKLEEEGWKGTIKEFNEEVKRRAQKDTNKRIQDLYSYLELNED